VNLSKGLWSQQLLPIASSQSQQGQSNLGGMNRVVVTLIGYRTIALPRPLPEDRLKSIRAAIAGTGNSPVR
jgi:hypothetical protein